MREEFTKNIRPLIEMYYYTDSQNLRFLAWIKGTPGLHPDIKGYVKIWKDFNETSFNNIKEL